MRESLIFRPNSNGEDLGGYAGMRSVGNYGDGVWRLMIPSSLMLIGVILPHPSTNPAGIVLCECITMGFTKVTLTVSLFHTCSHSYQARACMNPSRWTSPRPSRSTTWTTSSYRCEYVWNGSFGMGTKHAGGMMCGALTRCLPQLISSSPTESTLPSLTPIQDPGFRKHLLSEICKVGASIETALEGMPQDIEGVVAPDGAITVVQTRPQV